MSHERTGQIAVIFVSERTADDSGYDAAAAAMAALAATQPGYAGIVSARDADGSGITISYWHDEASALAWRAHPEHAAIRDLGRARWYARYETIVTEVRRNYDWTRG
jgi:heme-degrading monooxygenase HmoA